jgi:hypothetical protein
MKKEIRYLRFQIDVDYWLEEVDWNGEHYEFFDGYDSTDDWMKKWSEIVDEKHSLLEIVIDIQTGEVQNWLTGKYALFNTVKIQDLGTYALLDKGMNVLYEYSGYVPKALNTECDGFGDYLEFNILADGKVDKWTWTEDKENEIINYSKKYNKI